MWFSINILMALLMTCLALETNAYEIVFIILSQENSFHQLRAKELKNDIIQQSQNLDTAVEPTIYITKEDFPSKVGDWTVLPLLPALVNLHQQKNDNYFWFMFLQDCTKIRLKQLVQTLSKYNHSEEILLGNAQHDREATIIHHFAFHDDPEYFKYPHMLSGIAMNHKLVKNLVNAMNINNKHVNTNTDFNIDAGHELALYIWNYDNNRMVIDDSAFCIQNITDVNCATFPKCSETCVQTNLFVPTNEVYYAVKTFEQFHQTRVSIVQATWGKYVEKQMNFFSDIEDKTVPTISTGVPNTKQGHCAKTMAILNYIANHLITKTHPQIKWVLLADDDTIVSPARLHALLSCYDPTQPIALGERYGYAVQSQRQGYNYLTGGAGIVFSRALIDLIMAQNPSGGRCQCPSPDTPDDMFLGLCLAGMGVAVTHSPAFHQARPDDYPEGYLKSVRPISFHKHWMLDPVKVYKQWFREEDERFFNETKSKQKEQQHIEL